MSTEDKWTISVEDASRRLGVETRFPSGDERDALAREYLADYYGMEDGPRKDDLEYAFGVFLFSTGQADGELAELAGRAQPPSPGEWIALEDKLREQGRAGMHKIFDIFVSPAIEEVDNDDE